MIDKINQAHFLNQVYQQFDQFRLKRKKQTKFPDTLWQQAITLLEHHSMTEVSRALQVSAQQIKAQMHKNSSKNDVQMDFVEIKQPIEKSTPFRLNTQSDYALKPKSKSNGLMVLPYPSRGSFAEALNTLYRRVSGMLQITPQHKLLLAIQPADVRKGIDGLAHICKTNCPMTHYLALSLPLPTSVESRLKYWFSMAMGFGSA